MDKVFIHGKMGENMMVAISLIKNMDLVFIHGQIKEDTKAIG